MHNRFILRNLTILLVVALFSIAVQDQQKFQEENEVQPKVPKQLEKIVAIREKRALGAKKGFFRTLFSVIFEQYNDTKNTFSTVNKLINDNFLPENAPPPTTPPSGSNETSTQPFKITRSEFNRILRRNLKGLVRLYNIELNDALKQSEKNYREYKKNASVEVGKFL